MISQLISLRRANLHLAFLVATFGFVPALPAATVTVNVSNFAFAPATVNVQAGDTVRWVNNSGFHNVQALDDSFSSGNPTSNFVFEHTFNGAGGFDYLCEVHGSGMSGRVNVAAGSDPPGVISLTAATVSVGEGASTLNLTLTRTGGDDGAVSVEVDSNGGTATASSDFTPLGAVISWPDNDDNNRVVQIPILDDTLDEPNETFTVVVSNPTGGASLGLTSVVVTIVDNDEPISACVANATTLCLNQDRFQVKATWALPSGDGGQAQALDVGLDDTGLFTFFGPQNVELLVKVLNGCTQVGLANYWVFISAATNVAWQVTVIDTSAGISQVYSSPQGTLPPLLADTSAFATCP